MCGKIALQQCSVSGLSEKGDQVAITEFDDPNIVSGQAIARYEFGIGKGTFWSPTGKYLAFYRMKLSA